MSSVICAPPEFLRRFIAFCPTCKGRRRFAGREAAWYGVTVTCCGCGDSWTDGERHPRPFCRGWRAEAAAKAKQLWKTAGKFDPAAHEQWLREQLGERPTEDVPTGGAL